MDNEIISEIWRPVAGFPDYEVSDLGHVRRATISYIVRPQTGIKYIKYPAGRMLKPYKAKRGGYNQINLWKDKKSKGFLICWIVCRTFHGEKPTPRHGVAHNNGVSTDDRANNLRWATPAENEADKNLHGTVQRGERNYNTNFTEDDIRTIRLRLSSGETCVHISADYGVVPATIWRIKKRKNWRHVN
jgi:hypothetical protein